MSQVLSVSFLMLFCNGYSLLVPASMATFFTTLFKSITCDNGVEFQDFKGIEQSVYSKKKKRTKVYFAHPCSSFERGSNENANRLIRRFLHKGSTFDELSQRVVQRLARWMNKIPRKLFDGKSANEMVKALRLNFGDAKH